MQVKWKVFILNIAVWMFLELLLNLLNLDQMADYSEFLFHPPSITLTSVISLSLTTGSLFPNNFCQLEPQPIRRTP